MPLKCFRIAVVLLLCASAAAVLAQAPTEAPAGFDNLTNGFVALSATERRQLLVFLSSL